ncbi:thioredoxin-like protein [Gongronella butleri]|nr:thioredoxin-like protein [Gongronella butleri]
MLLRPLLALAALCVPLIQAGNVELDKPKFDEIAKGSGIWLIEFFSPFCGHCQRFAPTWKQLTEENEAMAQTHNVHFASVNCIERGDLCHEQKIPYFPTIRLYRGGQVIAPFPAESQRSLENLNKFIIDNHGRIILEDANFALKNKGHVNEQNDNSILPPAPVVADDALPGDEDPSPAADDAEPKAIDDKQVPVAAPAADDAPHAAIDSENDPADAPSAANNDIPVELPAAKVNPDGKSVDLDGPALDTIITDGTAYFIKFYAPWCPHCKRLAPTWEELARQLKGKVNIAEVNCDVHRDVCKTQGIRGFPTLIMYSNGKTRVHAGSRDLGSLLDFATSASKGTVKNVDLVAFDREMDPAGVSLLFLHKDESDDFRSVLEDLSARFSPDVSFYSSTDDDLMKRYGFERKDVPRALIIKNGRSYPYFSIFLKTRADGETLASFIDNERYPLVANVSPLNAPGLLQGERVVMLATYKKDDTATDALFRKLATERYDADAKSKAHAERLVFAHADADLYGDYISRTYDIKKGFPAIVLIDGLNKQFLTHDVQGKPLSLSDPDALWKTVDASLDSTITGKSTQSYHAQLTQQLRNGYQSAQSPRLMVMFLVTVTGYVGYRVFYRSRKGRPYLLPTTHQD